MVGGAEGRRAEQDRKAPEASLVGDQGLERLEVFPDRFNVFESRGVAHQELRHPGSPAFLTDPPGAATASGKPSQGGPLRRVPENAGENAAPLPAGRETVASMRNGSVMADIAIDRGGWFKTGRPTARSEPPTLDGGLLHGPVAEAHGLPYTNLRQLPN